MCLDVSRTPLKYTFNLNSLLAISFVWTCHNILNYHWDYIARRYCVSHFSGFSVSTGHVASSRRFSMGQIFFPTPTHLCHCSRAKVLETSSSLQLGIALAWWHTTDGASSYSPTPAALASVEGLTRPYCIPAVSSQQTGWAPTKLQLAWNGYQQFFSFCTPLAMPSGTGCNR